MKIGFDPRRVERLAALATHAIAEGCTQSGHAYLSHQDFARIIAKLDPTVGVMEAVEAAIAMQEPIVIDDGRFYSQEILEAEMSLAKKLAWREKAFSKACIFSGTSQELDAAIEDSIQGIGLKRDETQIKAIRGLLTTKATVHSITAGPGCGKTAIMEVVTKIIKDRKKTIHLDGVFVEQPMKIGFCAPTGKAAKVLNSRVSRFGLSATTIHSLLGVMGQGGFIHNRFNKLDLDLLVVDETSMVDLLLANALMDAVEPGCHIVFLGDAKQLPSVGPGNVLADLMALPLNHYRLSQPHRNKGGILDVVTKAGEGEVEFVSMDDVRFVPQLPEATEQGIRQSVIRMYWEALKDAEGDFTKVGLLIARRKGDAQTPGWNVTYLNSVLRELYNPAPKNLDFGGFMSANRRREVMAGIGRVETLPGEKVPGTRLRANDRIIVRKNILLGEEPDSTDSDQQVVNGDTGFIGDIWMHGGLLMGVELVLDDGRRVALPSSDTDILDLAYAMTVHAAQGSEYERVIFVCVNGTPNFVHRGIVFTAFSRAKKHLTVMGEVQDVRQVVSRPMPKRNSCLCERFKEEVDG
jgi:exodeoxyribonuclease V alpha subunit